MKVLVTGATGFLGRNILRALKAHAGVEPVAACRDRRKLDPEFRGEVRPGDLLDPDYRRSVCEGVDVLCHAGTWASLWGHRQQETRWFYEPTRALIENAMRSPVRRFVLASTVAIAPPSRNGETIDDLAEPRRTGFWPHLDRLVDVDLFMRDSAHLGMQMVCMRLGHFVGAGNAIGLLPALVPRLKTRFVPWLADGRARLPLITDADLGRSFALAAVAAGLEDYESFNICGREFPTAREVIAFIAENTGCPTPSYSVPYDAGYLFGWLMEKLHPVLPGSSPFFTRSIVRLAEDWPCATDRAKRKLGYVPTKSWRVATREALAELRANGYPWSPLAQSVPSSPWSSACGSQQ